LLAEIRVGFLDVGSGVMVFMREQYRARSEWLAGVREGGPFRMTSWINGMEEGRHRTPASLTTYCFENWLWNNMIITSNAWTET